MRLQLMVVKIAILLVGSYDYVILQPPTMPENDQNHFLVDAAGITAITHENGGIVVFGKKRRFCSKPSRVGFATRLKNP